MGSMQTNSGGDFNQRNPAWYWTKEEPTAKKSQRYGKMKFKWAEIWIIQIQIPKTFIDTLRTQR